MIADLIVVWGNGLGLMFVGWSCVCCCLLCFDCLLVLFVGELVSFVLFWFGLLYCYLSFTWLDLVVLSFAYMGLWLFCMLFG